MARHTSLFSLLDGQEDEGMSKIAENVFASTAAAREAAVAVKEKKAEELAAKKKAAEEKAKQERLDRLDWERRRDNYFRNLARKRFAENTLNQQGESQAVYNNNNNGSRAASERPSTGDSKRSEQSNPAIVLNDNGDKRINGNGYQNGGRQFNNNQNYRPYNGNGNRNGMYNNGGGRRSNSRGPVVKKASPKVEKAASMLDAEGFQLVPYKNGEPKKADELDQSSNKAAAAASDVVSVRSEPATTASDVVSVRSEAATADSKSEVAQGDSTGAEAEQQFVKRGTWNKKKPKKTKSKKTGDDYKKEQQKEEVPAEAAAENLTFVEYTKILAEKKAALESLKSGSDQKREVTLDKELVLFEKKKDVKAPQAEKKVVKKEDEKSEKKAVKKMNINEFLKPAKKGYGRRIFDDHRSGGRVVNGKVSKVAAEVPEDGSLDLGDFPVLGAAGHKIL